MSVRLPMQFCEIELDDIDRYLVDDGWAVEQKMDGTRGLFVLEPGHMRVLHAGGGVLKHSAATQHLGRIERHLAVPLGDTPGEIVVDGEIMIGTGEVYLFDLPYARYGGVELVRPTDPLHERRRHLEALGAELAKVPGPVRVLRQAREARAKREMVRAARAAGIEGLMLKRLDAPYQPGKRVTHAVKAKFVKTADVIVGEVNRPDPQHGSATLYLVDPDRATDTLGTREGVLPVRRVGGCSLIGKPEVSPGDVIEVRYLYWTGEALYQPRMLRVRPDKVQAQCRIDQLPEYSREVV